jgi:hypothetical protein
MNQQPSKQRISPSSSLLSLTSHQTQHVILQPIGKTLSLPPPKTQSENLIKDTELMAKCDEKKTQLAKIIDESEQASNNLTQFSVDITKYEKMAFDTMNDITKFSLRKSTLNTTALSKKNTLSPEEIQRYKFLEQNLEEVIKTMTDQIQLKFQLKSDAARKRHAKLQGNASSVQSKAAALLAARMAALGIQPTTASTLQSGNQSGPTLQEELSNIHKELNDSISELSQIRNRLSYLSQLIPKDFTSDDTSKIDWQPSVDEVLKYDKGVLKSNTCAKILSKLKQSVHYPQTDNVSNEITSTEYKKHTISPLMSNSVMSPSDHLDNAMVDAENALKAARERVSKLTKSGNNSLEFLRTVSASPALASPRFTEFDSYVDSVLPVPNAVLTNIPIITKTTIIDGLSHYSIPTIEHIITPPPFVNPITAFIPSADSVNHESQSNSDKTRRESNPFLVGFEPPKNNIIESDTTFHIPTNTNPFAIKLDDTSIMYQNLPIPPPITRITEVSSDTTKKPKPKPPSPVKPSKLVGMPSPKKPVIIAPVPQPPNFHDQIMKVNIAAADAASVTQPSINPDKLVQTLPPNRTAAVGIPPPPPPPPLLSDVSTTFVISKPSQSLSNNFKDTSLFKAVGDDTNLLANALASRRNKFQDSESETGSESNWDSSSVISADSPSHNPISNLDFKPPLSIRPTLTAPPLSTRPPTERPFNFESRVSHITTPLSPKKHSNEDIAFPATIANAAKGNMLQKELGEKKLITTNLLDNSSHFFEKKPTTSNVYMDNLSSMASLPGDQNPMVSISAKQSVDSLSSNIASDYMFASSFGI